MFQARSLLLPVLVALATGCVAPRAQMQSGRVTPDGELRAGIGLDVNVGTASAGSAFDGLADAVKVVAGRQEQKFDESVQVATKAAVAYSLDPVFSAGLSLGLRYGVYPRVDVGWRTTFGANAFDARFQFLGAPGRRAKINEGPGDEGWAGSVGLQYSGQEFELPSVGGLDKLQSVLGFTMSRRDFLVPITFSKPFGPDETYGAVSFGVVGGYSTLFYGFEPKDMFKEIDGVKTAIAKVNRDMSFATGGAFVNVKGGFRYGYAGIGLAVYYQNYGRFQLLDQVTFDLAGVSIVPSVTLEGRY